MMSTTMHVVKKSNASKIGRTYGENEKLRTKTTRMHMIESNDWRKECETVETMSTSPIFRINSTPKTACVHEYQPVGRTFPPVAARFKPAPDEAKVGVECLVVKTIVRNKAKEDIEICKGDKNSVNKDCKYIENEKRPVLSFIAPNRR
eukprot:2012623-Prymnesium_polylepis.4